MDGISYFNLSSEPSAILPCSTYCATPSPIRRHLYLTKAKTKAVDDFQAWKRIQKKFEIILPYIRRSSVVPMSQVSFRLKSKGIDHLLRSVTYANAARHSFGTFGNRRIVSLSTALHHHVIRRCRSGSCDATSKGSRGLVEVRITESLTSCRSSITITCVINELPTIMRHMNKLTRAVIRRDSTVCDAIPLIFIRRQEQLASLPDTNSLR